MSKRTFRVTILVPAKGFPSASFFKNLTIPAENSINVSRERTAVTYRIELHEDLLKILYDKIPDGINLKSPFEMMAPQTIVSLFIRYDALPAGWDVQVQEISEELDNREVWPFILQNWE